MQTSVKLQPSFSYGITIIVLIIIAIIIVRLLTIIKKKEEKEKIIIKELNEQDLIQVKNKYIKQLNELEHRLENEGLKSKKAYQILSKIIRNFVYEVTNIKVQNYTLIEINNLDIPVLSELIEEYYEPEFSKNKQGDIGKSIEKTRKVIEKWN